MTQASPLATRRDGDPLIISSHAIDRAVERVDLRALGVRRRDVGGWLAREVVDALAEGRRAKRLPAWLDSRRRRLGAHKIRVRVAWTADCRVAFILRGIRDEGGPTWLVLTVLVAGWGGGLTAEEVSADDRI